MPELCVPLDYELLNETIQLRMLLDQARKAECGVGNSELRTDSEAVAELIFAKLFRKLGYLARSTNKPGWLTVNGAEQLQRDVGAHCGDVVGLLVKAELLVPSLGDGAQDVPGGATGTAREARALPAGAWMCPMFARLNPHLAGDFRPKHLKGNDMRQVSIAIKDAAAAAPHQAMLLMPEALAGGKYTPQELDRLMLLIGTVDKIFKFTRQRTQFTEPLIRSAAAACAKVNYNSTSVPEELRQFLGWLITHRENARVPQSTEQLLQDFEALYALSKS